MQEALVFASSAPFITLIIQLVLKPLLGERLSGPKTPLVALALAVAWGLVLKGSGRLEADPAEFIFLSVNVAAAAAGVKTWIFDTINS